MNDTLNSVFLSEWNNFHITIKWVRITYTEMYTFLSFCLTHSAIRFTPKSHILVYTKAIITKHKQQEITYFISNKEQHPQLQFVYFFILDHKKKKFTFSHSWLCARTHIPECFSWNSSGTHDDFGRSIWLCSLLLLNVELLRLKPLSFGWLSNRN